MPRKYKIPKKFNEAVDVVMHKEYRSDSQQIGSGIVD
jgi:hypothetical protein